jgi:hypothetical protein
VFSNNAQYITECNVESATCNKTAEETHEPVLDTENPRTRRPKALVSYFNFYRCDPCLGFFNCKFLVDWGGFEPPTSWMQARHSYR